MTLGTNATNQGGEHTLFPLGPAGLTSLERTVYDLLPHGSENAITQKRLAAQCGIGVRDLQTVLKELTEVRGLPIASSCGKPAGSFIPVTDEEIDGYIDHMTSRAVSCHRRIAALKRSAARSLIDVLSADLPPEAPAPPSRVDEPIALKPRPPRVCVMCSRKFPGWRKDAECCSPRCRSTFDQEKRQEAA